MTTPTYRHVVFDLDGTLADSAQDIANAVNHTRRTRGLEDLSLKDVRECIGDGARQLIARVMPEARESDIDAALRTFLDHYEAHLIETTRLYPGVESLLITLRHEGLTCSVLSNKPVSLCRRLLDGLGVTQHFVAILGGDSMPTKKPDPGGLEHLRGHLDLNKRDLLLIGDSRVDFATARAGGVDFRGVAWGFAADALNAEPGVLMVTHPDEIRAIVLGGNDQSPASRMSSGHLSS